MPWIANCSEDTAGRWDAADDTVCISITEPGHIAELPDGFHDVLRVCFSDFDPVGVIGDNGLILYPSKGCPKDAVLFEPWQARSIVEFVKRNRGKNVLVHCAAVVRALLLAFSEYSDNGGVRFHNGHVYSLMRLAIGLTPIGEEVIYE